MSVCCNSIESLGCFGSCDTIVTGLTADVTGTWTIKEDNRTLLEVDFTMGDDLDFANPFNEDKFTTFQIFKPDGSLFLNGLNDCFSVTVFPDVLISGGGSADTVSCPCAPIQFIADASTLATYSNPALKNKNIIVWLDGLRAISGVTKPLASDTITFSPNLVVGIDVLILPY